MTALTIEGKVFEPASPLLEERFKTMYHSLYVKAIKERGKPVIGKEIYIKRVNNVIIFATHNLHSYIVL